LKSGDLGYEKFTFRSNTDIKIAKGLTAGVNLAGRYDKNIRIRQSNGINSHTLSCQIVRIVIGIRRHSRHIHTGLPKGLTAGVNLAGRYDKTSQPWNSFYEIFKQTRVNVPTVPAVCQ